MSLIFRGDGTNVPLFLNPWQNTDMVNAKRFYLLIYSTSFKTFLHLSPWNKLVICKLPFENWYFSYPALGSTLNLGYIKKRKWDLLTFQNSQIRNELFFIFFYLFFSLFVLTLVNLLQSTCPTYWTKDSRLLASHSDPVILIWVVRCLQHVQNGSKHTTIQRLCYKILETYNWSLLEIRTWF